MKVVKIHRNKEEIATVFSDRFIMGSLDNWFFGDDDTGDLLDRKNADKLVGKASEVKLEDSLSLMNWCYLQAEGGIHLVTADGSIDCQGDPARQVFDTFIPQIFIFPGVDCC